MHNFQRTVPRHRAARIALFNHKGGVGKTTLTINIAVSLGSLGKRVLLVDSDPQCNLTSYYFNDEYIDFLLKDSDGEEGRTLWSAVKPVYDAGARPQNIAPIELENYPNVLIVPGDIQLSKFETELVRLWDDTFQRKPQGYNGTIALSQLINSIAEAYDFDYVFYDCGPNVGALNRVILLDSDYFIVPGACDQFSIRALTTLGIQLREWIKDWRTVRMLSPENVYDLPSESKLLGYILQRFRTYGRKMTAEAAQYADQFEEELVRNIYSTLRRFDESLTPIDSTVLRLGGVGDFQSRALRAQRRGQMLNEVGDRDQKAEATRTFRGIARRIIERTTSQD
jgi:cellulose biosynthesis protein BcsQ